MVSPAARTEMNASRLKSYQHRDSKEIAATQSPNNVSNLLAHQKYQTIRDASLPLVVKLLVVTWIIHDTVERLAAYPCGRRSAAVQIDRFLASQSCHDLCKFSNGHAVSL